MLNSNMNYPYPVLKDKTDDFKNSIVTCDIRVTNEKCGYKINLYFNVNNGYINKLLSEKKASFAIQIQCVSTWLRRLDICDSEETEIFLPSEIIHEKVELCPCIIALENIPNYSNNDFSDDYYGMVFNINAGEVLGIARRKKFDAIYRKDIIKKAASIVDVTCDEKCSTMECYTSFETIQVKLPKQQYNWYIENSGDVSKFSIMNSIVVMPALVQALTIMYNDEFGDGNTSGEENFAWYKTIKYKLNKLSKNDHQEYKRLLETPVKTAQILVDNISGKSLKILAGLQKV